MPDPLLYLKAMVSAAIVSAMLVLVMAGMRRSASAAWLNLVCALAIGLGLALGYFMLSWRLVWPPVSALDRLLAIVFPAALAIELIAGFPRLPRPLRSTRRRRQRTRRRARRVRPPPRKPRPPSPKLPRPRISDNTCGQIPRTVPTMALSAAAYASAIEGGEPLDRHLKSGQASTPQNRPKERTGTALV